jgi:hypothetical protein
MLRVWQPTGSQIMDRKSIHQYTYKRIDTAVTQKMGFDFGLNSLASRFSFRSVIDDSV